MPPRAVRTRAGAARAQHLHTQAHTDIYARICYALVRRPRREAARLAGGPRWCTPSLVRDARAPSGERGSCAAGPPGMLDTRLVSPVARCGEARSADCSTGAWSADQDCRLVRGRSLLCSRGLCCIVFCAVAPAGAAQPTCKHMHARTNTLAYSHAFGCAARRRRGWTTRNSRHALCLLGSGRWPIAKCVHPRRPCACTVDPWQTCTLRLIRASGRQGRI